MLDQTERPAPAAESSAVVPGRPARVSNTQLVVGVGLLMVAGHLGLRAWFLANGYFYADDYKGLVLAREDGGWSSLLMSYNGHLSPTSRALTVMVAESGVLNWPVAAASVLVLQFLTCLAALAMLVTLFGARWGVLAPLGIYLTTALSLPGFIWWGAATLLVGVQLAAFLAITTWVTYLRTGHTRWMVATAGAVALGLSFDVKALTVLPVLAFLALVHFGEGGPAERLADAWRRHWSAIVVGVLIVAAYLLASEATSQQTSVPSPRLIGDLVGNAVGRSVPSALVGGPWRYAGEQANPLADPPAWAVQLGWVAIAGTVAYGALRRLRTLRAWALLVLAALVDVALLAVTRASQFGASTGLELRYFADLTPVVCLAVALAFLELRGAPGSSAPRPTPLLTVSLGRASVVTATVTVCVLGLVSQVVYARHWSAHNESAPFMRELHRQVATHDGVTIADQTVGENIMASALLDPYNRLSVLVSLLGGDVSFARATPELGVVDALGLIHHADLDSVLETEPGPREGCGWLVRDRARSLPLVGRAIDFDWWLQIRYLASDATPITVRAGREEVESQVTPGVGELWVRVTATFDEVEISGLDPGASICVDSIQIGSATPGRLW